MLKLQAHKSIAPGYKSRRSAALHKHEELVESESKSQVNFGRDAGKVMSAAGDSDGLKKQYSFFRGARYRKKSSDLVRVEQKIREVVTTQVFESISKQGEIIANNSSARKSLKNISQTSAKLINWINLQSDLKIIYSLELHRHPNSELLSKSAEQVIAGWDIFSSSFISLKGFEGNKGEVSVHGNINRKTGCYGDINFILSVPPQNIIGTHSKDVNFDTHAGKNQSTNIVEQPYRLADGLFSGIGRNGKKVVDSYCEIMSPSRVLRKTIFYNEILVVGRKDVSIYAGLQPTGKVKVEEIIVAPRRIEGHPELKIIADEQRETAILKLAELNPAIKISIK